MAHPFVKTPSTIYPVYESGGRLAPLPGCYCVILKSGVHIHVKADRLKASNYEFRFPGMTFFSGENVVAVFRDEDIAAVIYPSVGADTPIVKTECP